MEGLPHDNGRWGGAGGFLGVQLGRGQSLNWEPPRQACRSPPSLGEASSGFSPKPSTTNPESGHLPGPEQSSRCHSYGVTESSAAGPEVWNRAPPGSRLRDTSIWQVWVASKLLLHKICSPPPGLPVLWSPQNTVILQVGAFAGKIQKAAVSKETSTRHFH